MDGLCSKVLSFFSFRTVDIYDMLWQDKVDLANYNVVAGTFGGPLGWYLWSRDLSQFYRFTLKASIIALKAISRSFSNNEDILQAKVANLFFCQCSFWALVQFRTASISTMLAIANHGVCVGVIKPCLVNFIMADME